MFLKSRRILHRDLKLANLLLSNDMEVKLCDFGLAIQLSTHDERRYSNCGTPNYMAPEIIEGSGYSFEADTWAIGVIIFTLITGVPPFETGSIEATYRKIKINDFSWPSKLKVTPEVKELV